MSVFVKAQEDISKRKEEMKSIIFSENMFTKL